MNAFAWIVALGAALGLVWIYWRAASRSRAGAYLDAGVLGLLLGLIGSRLGYAVLNWGYFSGHLQEILQFWHGGLTWEGALVGSLGGLFLSSWVFSLPVGELADRLIPLGIVMAVAIWLACWQAGMAYGAPVPQDAWWGVGALDELGVVTVRFPLQLIGALSCLVILVLSETFLCRLSRPGMAFSVGLGMLALDQYGLSLLRADLAPVWNGMHLESWAALGVLGVALVLALFFHLRGTG